MQLKLAENIKRYRKKMELTQEGLAEAFGVTVGAVSKWENGSNVPDVLTMMELANFFNISMDELLGYDMSSKNVNDMCDAIEKFCDDHDFGSAIREANEAMTRYPHNFKVLYTCATMYYFKACDDQDNKEDAKNAIRLYEMALNHISQNTESEIGEVTIREEIANMYRRLDPEKALEQLKQINYGGMESKAIGEALMKLDRRTEALDYYSTAMILYFVNQFEASSHTALALITTGKAADIKKAMELIEAELAILDIYAIPNKVTMIHKLKSVLMLHLGWGYACLGMPDKMKDCIRQAYALAIAFDNENIRSELAESIRFSYFSKKRVTTYDSIGVSAVSGIEGFLARKPDDRYKKVVKYRKEVVDCWNEIKTEKR